MNEPKPDYVMSALDKCSLQLCEFCPYVGRCGYLNEDALSLLREKDRQILQLKDRLELERTQCETYKLIADAYKADSDAYRRALKDYGILT